MLTRLQLGAEIDVATGDELRNGLKDLEDRLANRKPRPIYLPLPQQTLGTGIVAAIDHGSPPVGRIWELRYWCPLSGTPGGAAPACSLFIGPSALLATPSDLQPMQYLRLPNRTSYVFFGTEALWCHSNENVVVMTVAALSAGNALGSFLQVAEWREADIAARTGRP